MTLTMSFDPDTSLIFSAYETEDEVGKVLRTHLVVEQQMERLIKLASTAKVDKKTSFWAKVNLLRAIGVPEKVCTACEHLNDLRNAFAHNSNANIENTKDVSQRYLDAVEAFYPKLPQAHGTFARIKSKVNHEFTYDKADQGQRIVVAAAFLSSVIGVLPKLYQFGNPPQVSMLTGLTL